MSTNKRNFVGTSASHYTGIMPIDAESEEQFSSGLMGNIHKSNKEYGEEDSSAYNRKYGPPPEVPDNSGFPIDPFSLVEDHLNQIEKQMKLEEQRARGEAVDSEESKEESPLNYDELVSPLTKDQIREARKKDKLTKKPKISIIPEVHVFVLGKYFSKNEETKETSVVDIEEDASKYNAILKDIFSGDALLLYEQVEPIQNTPLFKVFLKIGRYSK